MAFLPIGAKAVTMMNIQEKHALWVDVQSLHSFLYTNLKVQAQLELKHGTSFLEVVQLAQYFRNKNVSRFQSTQQSKTAAGIYMYRT